MIEESLILLSKLHTAAYHDLARRLAEERREIQTGDDDGFDPAAMQPVEMYKMEDRT